MPLFEGVVCIDAMLAARLITPGDLATSAAARPGWTGLPRLRRVLLLCDAGAESPQESRLRLILVAGGLPRPVTQYEVRDAADVFVARLDMAYPVCGSSRRMSTAIAPAWSPPCGPLS
jgi:hypothetical protein